MFARCERMVGAMEQMLGGEVYHYHSKLIWKRPGDGAFAWHQDYGYWYDNGCLRPDMASCLIAIDRAERANGCLQVLEGSHHMGRIDHLQSGGQVVADPERLGEVKKVLDLVHCELDPGDALFTHCNLLHRSDPNTSDRTRFVLICCYNAASNDPYKEHHHPRYTPLKQVPDEAIKQVGLRLSDPGKTYLDLDDIEAFDPHG
jgi:ectoine hydroxylase-related dioxygenase (phytanoyl-CoA dioxygenase family)